jgi:hypothetical protein
MSVFYNNNDDDDDIPLRKKNIVISLSLPTEMLVAIDRRRGDVSRSKWVFRDLEKVYNNDMIKIRKEMGFEH